MTSKAKKQESPTQGKEYITALRATMSTEERKNLCEKYISKYPDRIPVIIDRANERVGILDKNKYLIPKELPLASFHKIIRKRITLSPEEALFIFIEGANIVACATDSIADMWTKYRNADDGLLYLIYGKEETFGMCR